jgi:hypothetical protein
MNALHLFGRPFALLTIVGLLGWSAIASVPEANGRVNVPERSYNAFRTGANTA